MFEQRIHCVLLQNLVQRVYFQVLPSDGEVICCWVELNPVDWLDKFKFFNDFVGSIINYVDPSFLPSR